MASNNMSVVEGVFLLGGLFMLGGIALAAFLIFAELASQNSETYCILYDKPSMEQQRFIECKILEGKS